MEKWEYNWVWIPANWKELKLKDGTKYRGSEEIFGYFNYLGDKGWELVSASVERPGSMSSAGNWLFVFKRRKA